jgi:tetratricopeptide (TPR) repeat protein
LNVEIVLLGRFAVRVDGVEVPAQAWRRRQAATLVKMLALAPRRQLHREQVLDGLWPDVPVDDAGPRLHKAAYFARRVLGPDSVVLRNDAVALFPDADVTVDAPRFEELARSALAGAVPHALAPVGEAHSLQRLAEAYLALGDRAGANRLLHRALPLARWSTLAQHLLQRLYGTMIRAADGPQEALAVIERAMAGQGQSDRCLYCAVMFSVPAAIACADAGDIDRARRFLADTERSAALWEGTAWQAGVLEARAHLARAEGDDGAAGRLLLRAAQLFDDAGQPLDAARCRRQAERGVSKLKSGTAERP